MNTTRYTELGGLKRREEKAARNLPKTFPDNYAVEAAFMGFWA